MSSICGRFIKKLVVIASLALAAGTQVNGQGFRFEERGGNRFEGIVQAENTSGGYIELTGVHVKANAQIGSSSEQLYLSFPLRSLSDLKVKVWEPVRNYMMVPKTKSFSESMVFSWPSGDVIKPLNIDIEKLRVIATNASGYIFPASLRTRASPDKYSAYRFIFQSKGGVELKGGVYREDKGSLLKLIDISREEDYGGVVIVDWECCGLEQRVAPAGFYHLKLEGKVFLRQTSQAVQLDIPFYHYGPTPK